MNSDLVSTRNLLLWLLQKSDPTFSIPSGNGSTSEVNSKEAGSFGVGSDATSSKPPHHQGFEPESQPKAKIVVSHLSTFHSRVVSFTTYNPRFSVASRMPSSKDGSSQTAQSFNFGEIHAVQERFHSLLKQRLQSEYENKPPLFPWESELSDYPAEVSDATGATLVAAVGAAAAPLWSTHVGGLQVPGLLPQPLLNALFVRCQELARAPIKQGVRLVRAVEDMFPEQVDLLEPIADMVLVPAYRSDSATQTALTQELANIAGGYDLARPEQQIALSMMAAQEILGALTLEISADKPEDSRQWLTPRGSLDLSVALVLGQLTIAVTLPDGGQVRLWDGEIEKRALRSQPGPLDIVLADPGLDKTYLLEVSLAGDELPLNFAIHLASV